MEIYKKFENKTIEILGGFTRTSVSLLVSIHWAFWTIKDEPRLEENLFSLDIHILCWEVTLNYWWKPKMRYI